MAVTETENLMEFLREMRGEMHADFARLQWDVDQLRHEIHAQSEELAPSASTKRAMEQLEAGKGKKCSNLEQLFAELGI